MPVRVVVPVLATQPEAAALALLPLALMALQWHWQHRDRVTDRPQRLKPTRVTIPASISILLLTPRLLLTYCTVYRT